MRILGGRSLAGDVVSQSVMLAGREGRVKRTGQEMNEIWGDK
jgi:hypothetical protein